MVLCGIQSMATAGSSCVIRVKIAAKNPVPARQDLMLWLADVTASSVHNTSRLDQWGRSDILTHNILSLMLFNLKQDKHKLKNKNKPKINSFSGDNKISSRKMSRFICAVSQGLAVPCTSQCKCGTVLTEPSCCRGVWWRGRYHRDL